MGLFKSKPKTASDILSVIDSPVVEKIYNFHVKISNFDRELEEKRSHLTDLRQKYGNTHKEYFANDFDEKVLKKSLKLKEEIAELETIIQQMEKAKIRDVAGREIRPKLKLTDEEKQSLINGYAPVKAKREELYQKVLEQCTELEKALDDLKTEQHKVNGIFNQLYSFMGMSTEEGLWAINQLDGFKGGEIDFRLQQIAGKHQFYFLWPMYY